MTVSGLVAERPDEQRALAAVEDGADWAVDLLGDLVRMPTVTGTSAEADGLARVAGVCAELGMDVDHWQIDLEDERAAPGFPGSEASRGEAWGLVARTGAERGRTLVLQGHIDVVPAGDPDAWDGDPWSAQLRGPDRARTVLHGRGACDMKGGLVSQLLALRALQQSGVDVPADLALHAVMSEEDGGLGAFATLRRGYGGDACVIAEPTSGAVLPANAGALTFTLTVHGSAAHGSTRWAGHSAFEAFLPVYTALKRLEADRARDPDPLLAHLPIAAPLSVGRVASGDWSSSVPDSLRAEGRYGVRIGEPVEQARRDFELAVAEACAGDPWLRAHPVEVEWSGGQFASGRTDPQDPLVGLVRRSLADATDGRMPQLRAAPYGSDLRLYTAAGIPTVQVGPGDVATAHSPRESVPVGEVLSVARALALTALRFGDGDRPGA